MTALVGAAFLNQPLGLTTWAGLAVATAGVLLTKLRFRPVAAPAQRTPVRACR